MQEVKETAMEKAADMKETAKKKVTEMMAFIRKVTEKAGMFSIPIQDGIYIKMISDRESLREPDNVEQFVIDHDIDTFEKLSSFWMDTSAEYGKQVKEKTDKKKQKKHLKAMSAKWDEYSPYKAIVDGKEGLGFVDAAAYDHKHHKDYKKAKELSKELRNMKKKGEKITPKSWITEIEAIDEALPGIDEKIDDAVIKLAYCETISHTRDMMERRTLKPSLKARFRKHQETIKQQDEERAMRSVPRKEYEPEL